MDEFPMRLYVSVKYFVIHWKEKNLYLVLERNTHQIYSTHTFSFSDKGVNPEDIFFLDIFLILGVIPIGTATFIAVATKAEIRGEIMGCKIFEIKEAELIEFNRSEGKNNSDSHKANILKLLSTGFYFSYQYELTQSLSLQKTHEPDRRFFWNYELYKEFISQNLDPVWLVPIIQGFVSIFQNELVTLALVSRRSCERTGTRYNCRGIDKGGNVANFVESEQILIVGENLHSFIQVRGSVPLYWEQTGVIAQLSITKSREMSLKAFQLHADKLIEKYRHVTMVNLLSNSKSYEKLLTDEWEFMFNKLLPEYSQRIAYNYFDFHATCKGQKYHKVGLLVDNISSFIDFSGYYSSAEGTEQKGVVRTNCLDCLDRTNVVQGHIAKEVLMKQLRKLNLDYALKQDPEFLKAFRTQWADNGDDLSFQYTGTGSTISAITRDGPTGIRGLINQGITSIGRFYYANVSDDTKQISIDSVLRKKNKTQIINKVEEEMKRRSEEYLTYVDIKIRIVTWNLSGKTLSNVVELCETTEKCEILVFGFQQVKDFNENAITNLLEGYSKLSCICNGEYAMVIYVDDRIIDEITMFDYDVFPIFCKDRPTSKLAVALVFTLYDSTFCFIACHLASGTDNSHIRKDQIRYIYNAAFNGSKRLFEDFDAKFLFGNLNFRINLNTQKILGLIQEENYSELLKAEQLTQNLKHGYLLDFNEFRINFPPTYPFNEATCQYENSKKREPSWCDRILYSGSVCPFLYSDIRLDGKLHRPVQKCFTMKVKKIDEELKRSTEEKVYGELAAGPLGSLPKMACAKDLLSCN